MNRLAQEAEARREPLSYRFARWVEGGPERIQEVAHGGYDRTLIGDP